MRFARTKLFGIFRDVFRAIGQNLVRMKLLEDRQVGGWVAVYTLCVYSVYSWWVGGRVGSCIYTVCIVSTD